MQIIHAPDPKLRVKTKPVKKITPGLLSTLKQMIKLTKTFKDPEGVGLASTQVGFDGQFFVALASPPASEAGKKFLSVINPKILSTSKRTKKYFEGCLSVPNVYGEVKRYTNIKVSFLDESGKLHLKALKGIPAWIFQHEMDHLEGTLFSDRVLQQKSKFYKWMGRDKTGQDIFEEINI
ncbi:peptide deformylase [Candidatus Daviesbacteria bacterium]|nr:peptide deformylase [Candidatus Daviesbacteria bacterium]